MPTLKFIALKFLNSILDINYKSPKELIESLCDCRKVGANLLLNIGSTAQGGIDSCQRELFALIGKWTDKFGEAIYNGRPYPASSGEKHFVLKSEDGKKLCFFIYDLGIEGHSNVTASGSHKGDISFTGMTDKLDELHRMDNGKPISFEEKDGTLSAVFTGFDYGTGLCVRVASATVKDQCLTS